MRARFGVIRAFARPARGGRLLLLGLLVGMFAASAQAATSTKFYSATVTPTPVEAGVLATFTVTVNNLNTSTQSLGSANVTVPASFAVPSGTGCLTVTAPAGKNWTACYVAPNIEFRAASSKDAILPGSSVSATIQATPSAASLVASDFTWLTVAKQSNSFSGPPGNSFIRTGGDPVVRVVGRLCTSAQPTCQLSSGGTTAETAPPTGANTIEMTLLSDSDFICNGVNVPVGLILLINSSAATEYTVTLTYTGVTGNVDVCKSNDGSTFELLPDCGQNQGAPCVESDSGNPRVVVVRLAPGDPYVGGS